MLVMNLLVLWLFLSLAEKNTVLVKLYQVDSIKLSYFGLGFQKNYHIFVCP